MAKQRKKNKQKNVRSKADKDASKTLCKHLTLNPDMPSQHFGLDFFYFWNGDVYVGNYKATINKDILREGNGKYFTDDGSCYNGVWVNDELTEAMKINFKDGPSYTGYLLNGQYNGQGVYSVPGIGTFSCNFVDGKPLGVVLFDDVDNNKWQGNADSLGVTVCPKNHFFYSEVTENKVNPGEQQNKMVTNVINNMEEIKKQKFKNPDNNVPMILVTEHI